MPSEFSLFHKHLDVCEQCADNPFDLCRAGHKLLTGEEKPGQTITAKQVTDLMQMLLKPKAG